ncbi:hypothetical protein V6N12_045709 [Hibiscus sabdariffa]|uniref:Uncharacterized protein n=1 Tax=Hibiscus sabdariffa TaxID=183260 RepID=A0ABR2G407_9ROSI
MVVGGGVHLNRSQQLGTDFSAQELTSVWKQAQEDQILFDQMEQDQVSGQQSKEIGLTKEEKLPSRKTIEQE